MFQKLNKYSLTWTKARFSRRKKWRISGRRALVKLDFRADRPTSCDRFIRCPPSSLSFCFFFFSPLPLCFCTIQHPRGSPLSLPPIVKKPRFNKPRKLVRANSSSFKRAANWTKREGGREREFFRDRTFFCIFQHRGRFLSFFYFILFRSIPPFFFFFINFPAIVTIVSRRDNAVFVDICTAGMEFCLTEGGECKDYCSAFPCLTCVST